jgi:cell wall-active antibiotic response 4TMS protein YvqF
LFVPSGGLEAERVNLAELERARAVARERLGAGYADDLIDADELDRRLEALERAATPSEIAVLVDDLAAPHVAMAPVAPSVALVPIDSVAPSQRIKAWFSETKRVGRWTAAQVNEVQAICASVRLDLRDAQLSEGTTTFSVQVVMGEIEIITLPGLPVDVDCSVFFGEVDQDEAFGETQPTTSARVRVIGRVWLGSLEVREQLPGESRSDARKRRKAERKRLAESHKRKALGPAR